MIKGHYKRPFQFKGIHHCQAVVLACIDFRFWKETQQFIEEKLGIQSYDFPKLPGAVKAINEAQEGDVALQCISVPVQLHQVKRIVLINHSDCGAYGGSKFFENDSEKEQAFHEAQLKKAKEKMLGQYADKEVILVYAKLVDDGSAIEFVEIE